MKNITKGKIKAIRVALNLSQEQFAEILETSQHMISQYETGKKGISFEVFVSLVNKFNVNPMWFIRDEGEIFGFFEKGGSELEEENKRLKAKIEALLEAFKAIGNK